HGFVHHVTGVVGIEGVVAHTAGHGVGTGAAVQRVVAAAAAQRVLAGGADDVVGELVTGKRQAGCASVRPQDFELRTSGKSVADGREHRVGAPACRLVYRVDGAIDVVGVIAGAPGHGVGAG